MIRREYSPGRWQLEIDDGRHIHVIRGSAQATLEIGAELDAALAADAAREGEDFDARRSLERFKGYTTAVALGRRP